MMAGIATRLAWRCLLGLLAAAYCGRVLADPPNPQQSQEKTIDAKKRPGGKFLRLKRDEDGQPLALQTAIVRYVPASGEGELEVDLVAAVHIADGKYYQKLNKHFERYDAMLYELVAKPGTRIPKGGRRDTDNPLAMLQQMSSRFLQLESQTEVIDYTKKNFIHADLSPEGMAEAIKKRGDDGVTLFLSVTADLLRQQNLQAQKQQQSQAGRDQDADEELDPLETLLDPDGPLKLKRTMAEQFEKFDSPGSGLGPTINTILIADRNQAALRVFQTELAKGKKKIAIFYGAAHMPDFDKRLQREFGLKRDNVQWLTAWDLSRRATPSGIEGLFRILDDLSR